MAIDFLLDIWQSNRDREAIISRDTAYTYDWLLTRFLHWKEVTAQREIRPGAVVVLEADFSPNAVALFFALIDHNCIVVPLSDSAQSNRSEFLTIAEAEVSFKINSDDTVTVTPLPNVATHPLYAELREVGHPGLVLFSSGSTGGSKAAVHDMLRILEKFKIPRQRLRAITFLLYDHIGGINTLLYTMANAGCIITVNKRDPDSVLEAVEKHRVELLPTSPTFLNLVLLSQAYKRYDLGSLKTITYGTEPMPETTLKRFHELYPGIHLQQTYGLSELGILRSKSKDQDSLWVRVGGDGFETRVVDGILHVKARSAMLGYLNAASPFTDDGWFNTGDAVEVDGEYIRILGRKSEIVNVGGQKVYPAEVENVIQELAEVAEVTVYGERHPITGSIVCADITPSSSIDESQQKEIVLLVKKHCREKLASYKVPIKVRITSESQHTERFKKARR
ncbi:MAG TPA: fatty acid--CoA ligase family protein [Pyrinomonadaceae bacterium]|nr:fatty acid--CoA ligase family protein [Pyrinomonadaceae bacterium]